MAAKKKRQPNPLKVPLTYLRADVYESFKKWCKDRGLIQQHFMSEVVTFIMELDKSTRAVLLDEVNEEDRSALAKRLLERIAIGQLETEQEPSSPQQIAKDAVSHSADEATQIIKNKGTRRKKRTKHRLQG